jgi:restriction system protein
MAPNSLFAILLRSPWWISIGIAVAFGLASRAMLPPDYFVFGAMGGLPFAVIGVIAAARQLSAPSASRVAAMQEAAAAMSWKEFADALEDAFRRDGFHVERVKSDAADFSVVKSGRRSLVGARRWKAANLGVEPLKELAAAAQAAEAQGSICVTLGAISDNARDYAKAQGMQLLQGQELAALLSRR